MERLRRRLGAIGAHLVPAAHHAPAAAVNVSERRLDHRNVHAAIRTVLAAGGANERVQQVVADHLIDANLRGHDSHGIQMVSKYMKAVKQGTLAPNAPGRVLKDTRSVLVIDGGQDTAGGYGQVIALDAMQRAIQKTSEHGICALAIRAVHHIGRTGTYTELAARYGYVAMCFVNVAGHAASVAPFGGADKRLGTNPMAVAVPMPAAHLDGPISLDFATSIVAGGKVGVKANRKEPMEKGVLIDEDGEPTIDPIPFAKQRQGSILPFGLHKGGGIQLICELLGGALSGGWTADDSPLDRPAAI